MSWEILNCIQCFTVDKCCRNLGMEYVDMYLVHWPVKLKPWACYAVPKEEDFEQLDLESTWAGMEKCLDMGLCRCIGVSNFSSKKVERLLEFASVPPAVNQVRLKSKEHKFHQNKMTSSRWSFGEGGKAEIKLPEKNNRV